jgi:hypothetical protein
MNQIAQEIVKKMQVEALPPEEQAKMVEQFSEILFQAILARGLEALSEEQKDALDKELEKNPNGGPDLFMDFFVTNIPDFQSMMDEEMQRIIDRVEQVMSKK